MQVSAKTEYACIAVFELAAAYKSGELLQVRRIAETHDIPSTFLVQILIQLKTAGLVVSTRGASGGYRLARPPQEITVWDVYVAIEGAAAKSQTNSRPSTQVISDVWRQANTRSRQLLQTTTFAQLLEQAESQAMYYI